MKVISRTRSDNNSPLRIPKNLTAEQKATAQLLLITGNYLHEAGIITPNISVSDATDFKPDTPASKALPKVVQIFEEWYQAHHRDCIRAGIAKARESGTKSGKAFGRPEISPERDAGIRALLRGGMGIRAVARTLNAGNGTVARIRQEMLNEHL